MAGTAAPFLASTGTASNAIVSLFDELPTDIDFTTPSEQSIIRAKDGTILAHFYAENRIVVASDGISQYLKDAAVAIEDERFYEHHGIDAQGIIGAALNNLTSSRTAGGSTITQQYVKNALIEKGRVSNNTEAIKAATETSIVRKLNEARYAIALERKYSKDEILTAYLNIAQFGPSQWGVETASRFFYSKPASEVTLEQAAMLVGATQAPNHWNPITNPEEAKKRRDTVLYQMEKLGYITVEERDTAIAVPIEDMLNVSPVPNGCENAGISAFFCDLVVNEILNSNLIGKDIAERTQMLYRGGLDITTTLDPKFQQAAYDALTSEVPIDDPSNVDGAISTIEPGTGKILAMVMNREYGQPTEEYPERTMLNVNVGRDQGGGDGFQPGSSYKIFSLAEWFRSGKPMNQALNTNPRTFYTGDFKASCNPQSVVLPPEGWRPQNNEGVAYGTLPLRQVLNYSLNIGTLEMSTKLDLCDVSNLARDMGARRGEIVTAENRNDWVRTLGNLPVQLGKPVPLATNPASLIGSSNVTPLSMASAVATLAAEGKACKPYTVLEIKDNKGKVLATGKDDCRQALDADAARATTSVLNYVVTGGGASNAQIYNHQTAGKTGTTDSAYNVWFVGYTANFASAVWMGHIGANESLLDITINGRYYRVVHGGDLPARAFGKYGNAVLADLPATSFKAPTRITKTDEELEEEKKKREEEERQAREGTQIPTSIIGMEYNEAAEVLRSAGFVPDTEGAWSDEPANSVIGTRPAAGDNAQPGSTVVLIVSVGPAPNSP